MSGFGFSQLSQLTGQATPNVDLTNTTAVALTGSQEFTGAWTDILNYATVTVTCISTATGTLFYQFSTDGVTVDRNVQLSATSGTVTGIHNLSPVAKYGRVYLNNGTGAQATLQLQTLLSPSFRQIVSRASQIINDYSDVQNVRILTDVKLDEASNRNSNRLTVSKFGRNDSIAAGTQETIYSIGAYPYPGFLTSSIQMRIKAGGAAADTSAGANARTVIVEGLDSGWNLASDTLVCSGASASLPTTTSFIRVHRAYVSGTGTYGASNAGNIDIETSDSTATMARIALTSTNVGLGRTQMAIYTVPDKKRAYVKRISANVEGTKTADVYFWVRSNANDVAETMTSPSIWASFTQIAGNESNTFESYPGPFGPMADIYVTAIAGTGGSGVNAEFDLILIDV